MGLLLRARARPQAARRSRRRLADLDERAVDGVALEEGAAGGDRGAQADGRLDRAAAVVADGRPCRRRRGRGAGRRGRQLHARARAAGTAARGSRRPRGPPRRSGRCPGAGGRWPPAPAVGRRDVGAGAALGGRPGRRRRSPRRPSAGPCRRSGRASGRRRTAPPRRAAAEAIGPVSTRDVDGPGAWPAPTGPTSPARTSPGAGDRLAQALHAAVGVHDRALVLGVRLGREDDVGVLARCPRSGSPRGR